MPNFHVVMGSDEGKVKEVSLKLVQKHTPAGGDEFSNENIEGTADNSEHAGRICSNVIQALQTYLQ